MSHPVILIVGDDPVERSASNTLADIPYRIINAGNGIEALRQITDITPDLVLMDLDMPRLDGWATTAKIRTGGPPSATVPIIAFTGTRVDQTKLVAADFDGLLSKPIAAKLDIIVNTWFPTTPNEALQRLATTFGHKAIEPLLIGFRDQLSSALLASGTSDIAAAHRIAGMAGMLGFPDVSETWLSVSEGDIGTRPAARRAARSALCMIEQALSGPGRIDLPATDD